MATDHNITEEQAIELADTINRIRKWAIDRDIIGPNQQGTLIGQSMKLIEESLEVREAIFALKAAEKMADLILPFLDSSNPFNENKLWAKGASEKELDSIKEQVVDGIGDTMVVCVLLCEMMDINVLDALNIAYNEIKDRKGKMVNGAFKKLYNNLN